MKKLTVAWFAIAACGVLAGQQKGGPDPVIEAARKAAAEYVKSLPDYTAKRITTRYQGNRKASISGTGAVTTADPRLDADISWNANDTVSADLIVAHGKEVYSHVTINGKPSDNPAANGSWSVGEFANQLEGVFMLKSDAKFSDPRKDTVAHRAAMEYKFEIDHAHSAWMINSRDTFGPQNWATGYGGEVWIDRETGQALKILMVARDLPASFPMDAIRSLTEYGVVKIGGASYVLPIHSEVMSCVRGQPFCSRNDTDYKNYDKFAADTSVSFGDGK